ncbi:MAG: hypothetical protein CM15mP74_20520 [Halieaceae bacterium]|nr:MAG: hypothetical protein CM15mP74_20520 [Halieaceae bacterium]
MATRGEQPATRNPHAASAPFFVVGCVRSGTTLLRDLLRQHPNLDSPEETHLFRWPHPFGTVDFTHIQEHNETLRAHREIDGVDEQQFLLYWPMRPAGVTCRIAMPSCSWRRRLPAHRGGSIKRPRTSTAYYFERGLSRCQVCQHRASPLNVVSSLRAGKVMGPHTLQAGIIPGWRQSRLRRSFSQRGPTVFTH